MWMRDYLITPPGLICCSNWPVMEDMHGKNVQPLLKLCSIWPEKGTIWKKKTGREIRHCYMPPRHIGREQSHTSRPLLKPDQTQVRRTWQDKVPCIVLLVSRTLSPQQIGTSRRRITPSFPVPLSMSIASNTRLSMRAQRVTAVTQTTSAGGTQMAFHEECGIQFKCLKNAQNSRFWSCYKQGATQIFPTSRAKPHINMLNGTGCSRSGNGL